MRIVIDQSGYDLLNIGDVAMLQGCVARLRQQWPEAHIMVVAHSPERLARYCPGTTAIHATFADRAFIRRVPRRYRLASEQVWKIAAPYWSLRMPGARARKASAGGPRTAVEAVRAADLVVASGGGYVTDVWWWHAAGVLSLLGLAQRLGKPTAMFGQGLGPVDHPALRAQAGKVISRLEVLGLREDRAGRDLATSLGVHPDRIVTTGDDALELVGDARAPAGTALGINVRVAGYSGVGAEAAAVVGEIALEITAEVHAQLVALPVSRYPADADLVAIRQMMAGGSPANGLVMHDINSPYELVVATAGCRAVITGSYHAAVFALAQGVPAVCLTRTPYYRGKFAGLQALFPDACRVVELDQPDLRSRLRMVARQAWNLPEAVRTAARDAAIGLRAAGRQAYREFQCAVEQRTVATSSSRELVT